MLLAEPDAWARAILASPLLICEGDDEHVLFASASALRLLGLSRDEVSDRFSLPAWCVRLPRHTSPPAVTQTLLCAQLRSRRVRSAPPAH